MRYEDEGDELRREYRWTAIITIVLTAGCFALFILALGIIGI